MDFIELAGGAGAWDPEAEGLCVYAAYEAKGAASFANSLLDLTSNGNHATDPGGAATPGWDAVNGWDFDGVANYLQTPFIPQNDQSQSVLVQYSNVTNTEGCLIGSTTAANNWLYLIPTRVTTQHTYANGRILSIAGDKTSGNMGLAGDKGYDDGSQEAGSIPSWLGASSYTTYIGATNQLGVPGNFVAAYIQAVYVYDCVLTATQVAAVAAAMAAL
jgi:hypothetical protein